MKKAKIWIRACVCILLYTTFAACSHGTGNQRVHDDKISLLKQNIPEDYKITVHFIPEHVSGMCWVQLNIIHVVERLKKLENMFGNNSSNRKNISVIVHMLQEERIKYRTLGCTDNEMGQLMEDFECHYKDETWQTKQYFDFVILPTTEGPVTSSTKVAGCVTTPECSSAKRAEQQHQQLPENWLIYCLLSLLIISMVTNAYLVWKVKGRRRTTRERNPESGDVFASVEEPPLDNEILEEKNRLNTIETSTF
ncbi:hypothetical protein AGOR_G00249190 [Albula goreensis]|uniref:Kit ligand n=1 Tax=Albula goreensis TaxID=1534307 RepID=A0A8T3CBK4_9TELE|nr:hypothetical protein AGOR_G00249190 [Albula goreensis]